MGLGCLGTSYQVEKSLIPWPESLLPVALPLLLDGDAMTFDGAIAAKATGAALQISAADFHHRVSTGFYRGAPELLECVLFGNAYLVVTGDLT